MVGPKVQTLLRKPLPLLFDPKHKLYPVVMVVTICLLVISIIFSTLCIMEPQHGLSSSTMTNTNEETDFLIGFFNHLGGLTQCVFSVAWLINNRGLIINIKKKIYKLQNVVCCDRELTWFSKELLIYFSLMIIITFSQGSAEIKTPRNLFGFVAFLMNISCSFVVSGQLSTLLQYLGSAYDSLLDLKNYESSVKWYQFLSTIYEDVWKLYQIPVLLISTWNLALTFTHLYLLFYPAFPGHILLNILYAVWIYLFCFPTLSIIRSCNYVIRKAKQFNEDIYWKMAEDKSAELLNNEVLDFHIMGSEEPIFTACGFFPLDNSLICSIISQITTYLVIVLQAAKSIGMTVEPTMNEKPYA
ncbi:Gustatory receptor 98a [Halyomorpha halys]|nr:Gustatory receptor 98a [Halyomorpha halys]